MAPKRTTRTTPVTTTPPPVADPTTTTSVTRAQLQAHIERVVTAVLAARDTTQNGDDSHTSGTGTEDGRLDLKVMLGWKPCHFKKDCPQWKSKNQGNGNAVAKAYAVGVAGQNPNNNVVTARRPQTSQKDSNCNITGSSKNFPEVFPPEDLPGLPTYHRQVEISHRSVPGAGTYSTSTLAIGPS
ncbi:hypothetical protein Tco_1449232 [Tanacetum coccineum]